MLIDGNSDKIKEDDGKTPTESWNPENTKPLADSEGDIDEKLTPTVRLTMDYAQSGPHGNLAETGGTRQSLVREGTTSWG